MSKTRVTVCYRNRTKISASRNRRQQQLTVVGYGDGVEVAV